MKNRLIIILSLATFFLISNISAQLQAGIFTGVKYGNLSQHDEINFFDSDFAAGGGINVRYNSKHNFYFTGTLTLENTGWAVFDIDDISFFRDEYVKGEAVAASLDIGYFVLETKKVKLGLSAGYKAGVILINKSFSQSINRDDIIVDIFGAYGGYKSIELKSDFIVHLTDKLDLNIVPNYSIFNRRFFNDNFYAQRNYGLQTGLLYSFSI